MAFPQQPRLAAAKLNRAITKAQTLTGEKVLVGGTPYPAIIPVQSEAQTIMTGTFAGNIALTVSIRRDDMPVVPPIGSTLVVARGVTYRLFRINPTFSTYELQLETPQK